MNGVAWYNRTRWERTPDGEKAIHVTANKREEWVAVPVPDAGIPCEWVDGAREAIKDNVRPSRADGRCWELKGLLYCPCGSRMVPYNSRRGGKRYHYYACGRYRREGPSACEHRKNGPAEDLEGTARKYVLGLLEDPKTMRRQVEQSLREEIAALRNPERKIEALAGSLAETDRMRVAYQRQQAEGLMSIEELRAHLSEVDARRAEAQAEFAALQDSRRRIDELRSYSKLVDEYLRELPDLLRGGDRPIRNYAYTEEHEERRLRDREEGRLLVSTISPEIFRERTPQEAQELREARDLEDAERYRHVYTNLGLSQGRRARGRGHGVHLEGVSNLCGSPRCKASETTSSYWIRSRSRARTSAG